ADASTNRGDELGSRSQKSSGMRVVAMDEGTRRGVRKVNGARDHGLASTGAIRRFLAENPAEFDPRKYLKASMKAMTELCIARYEAFGCAGQASKIQPINLERMFERYAAGELDPKVK
ncbi:MAG: class II fructose-bisphosphate aldolase, partial [Alteromonadaceae bacterium]|nr:class II fructose-bisphosphate aldolase [Alteromonadaceae bacterium]